MQWDDEITEFLKVCQQQGVQMILVGGGAVNFHGYQRHSVGMNFWIDHAPENLVRLKKALFQLGYEFNDFPQSVKEGTQNISIKFSPAAPLSVELITAFALSKSFAEALQDSEWASVAGQATVRYRVLSQSDLLESKLKAGRPKDILDIQELRRLWNRHN